MASDCCTAPLLYELLVDHFKLSLFFGNSFPCSKNLNLLLNLGLSCCWSAELFNYFNALFLLHFLCVFQKKIFIIAN